MNKEIWKDVVGHEGTYQVSNLGRVKRLPMSESKAREELILSLTTVKKAQYSGYNKVNLSDNGVKKTCFVHQLVAKAFIPNPENKYGIDHVDGDGLNNNLSNLRWATQQENAWNRKANKTYRGQARRNKYKGVYYSSTYKSAPNLDRSSGRKIAEDLKKGIDNRYTVKRGKPWNAQVMHKGKRITIGWYHTEKEAVEAYNEKVKELRGDYAVLNKYEN